MSTMSIRNSNSTSSLSYIQIELGKILRQHDPNAIRLHDFLKHIKVFHYNTNELHWDKDPQIEGNLFAYEKQQMINNQRSTIFALAVINREEHFIEEISPNMSIQTDKQGLFYEIIKNNKVEVYALKFLNEQECQHIYTLIRLFMERGNEQQSCNTLPTNRQITSNNFHQQQTSIHIRNIPTSTHSTIQQSIPMMNSNSNTQDPSSSLKRLLNIHETNQLFVPEKQTINLLPPSAFESLSNQSDIQFHREHIRHIFHHLIQHNEDFVNIIRHSCSNYQSQ